MQPYALSKARLANGFVCAVVVPAAFMALLSGPAWMAAGFIGLLYSGAATLLAATPVILVLVRLGKLRLTWVLLLAAVIGVVPSIVATAWLVDGMDGLAVGTDQLIEAGRLTPAGFVHFYVEQPLQFALVGITGGLAFWLTAIGWRAEPPRRAGESAG